MVGLIKNEFNKLLLRKKILITSIVFGILSILVCGFIFLAYKINTKETQIETQKIIINSYEENLKNAQTEEEKEEFQSYLDQAKANLKIIENSPSEEDSNWRSNVEETLNILKEQLNNTPSNSSQKEMIRKQIIEYEELLNSNIKPMSPPSPKGLYVINYLLYFLGGLVATIIIIIIASDMVSSECTPPTLKMLLTRPVSRGKVLASKFITAFIASCIVIIGIEIITSVIMGVIFGFGDPSYPMAVGTDYKITTLNAMVGKEAIAVFNSSYLTTMISFIFKSLLLQALYILAATSFFLMISTLLNSSTTSITISIVLLVATKILDFISYVRPALPFIFATYGDTGSVLNGELKANTLSSLPSPTFAVVILILWTAIPYVIAHLNFTKKDILV